VAAITSSSAPSAALPSQSSILSTPFTLVPLPSGGYGLQPLSQTLQLPPAAAPTQQSFLPSFPPLPTQQLQQALPMPTLLVPPQIAPTQQPTQHCDNSVIALLLGSMLSHHH
jgi:hypothetical protein